MISIFLLVIFILRSAESSAIETYEGLDECIQTALKSAYNNNDQTAFNMMLSDLGFTNADASILWTYVPLTCSSYSTVAFAEFGTKGPYISTTGYWNDIDLSEQLDDTFIGITKNIKLIGSGDVKFEIKGIYKMNVYLRVDNIEGNGNVAVRLYDRNKAVSVGQSTLIQTDYAVKRESINTSFYVQITNVDNSFALQFGECASGSYLINIGSDTGGCMNGENLGFGRVSFEYVGQI
eukprot:117381_1